MLKMSSINNTNKLDILQKKLECMYTGRFYFIDRFTGECKQTCRASASPTPAEVAGIRGGGSTQRDWSSQQPNTGGS